MDTKSGPIPQTRIKSKSDSEILEECLLIEIDQFPGASPSRHSLQPLDRPTVNTGCAAAPGSKVVLIAVGGHPRLRRELAAPAQNCEPMPHFADRKEPS